MSLLHHWGLIVSRAAAGLDVGLALQPWMRLPERSRHAGGAARILVDGGG